MADNDVSSGFIHVDTQSGELSFSNLSEIYVSFSGYARLFRCQRYNRLHILKALKPSYIGNPFYEQALRKEFDIGYQLEHPHICRALGWETLPELGHCIVLEYIDGATLRELMAQGRLTAALARKLIAELCDALNYLHGKQVVHRDLKPENILVTHNGSNIKLIDFGLSDSDDYEVLKMPAGTRYYLAPEALKPGQLPDLRADIYSLGILTGEMAELLKDKKLAALSRKCTRRKPEDRYPSAPEVVKALHRMDSARQLYQRIAAACAGLLLLTGGYLLWKTGTGSDSVTSLPVYGNYALPEPCWRYWEEDTVSAGRQEVLDEAFPLPVQRQSAMYTRYKDLTLRQ